MRRRLIIALLAVVPVAVPAGLALGAGNPQGSASASALGVLVKLPDGSSSSVAYAAAPPKASTSASGWGYGQTVSVGLASSSASTGPGADPRGQAASDLQNVSLFGGEITVDRIEVRAEAVARAEAAEGSLSGSGIEGLAVAGGAQTAGVNSKISLGYGYVVLLEQAIDPGDGDRPGRRAFVTALHVYLTSDHGGLPAGSEILVGYAEAAAERSASAPEEPESPATGEAETSESASAAETSEPSPSGEESAESAAPSQGPPAIVTDPPDSVRPTITGAGYALPVYGPVSFTNDFAAPRGDTIWHHGNDIFAPTGAPVLAVADGTLFMVGWNTLGGHRLWLRDDQGNEYYYAHLSAYSPLAVNGTRVQAGDVLAFVGQSGVSGGIPHLHFEIHPRALLGLGYDGVINPYTYLLAWQAQRDEQFSVTLPLAAGGTAPEPGAVLLGATDISTASGLDPARIAPILGPSELAPSSSRLVGAAPSFAD